MAFLISARLRYLFPVAAGLCLLPLAVLAFYRHPGLGDFAIGEYLRQVSTAQHALHTYFHSSGRCSLSLFSAAIEFFGRHPGAYQGLILGGLLAFVGRLGAVTASTAPSTGRSVGLTSALASLLITAAIVNFPPPSVVSLPPPPAPNLP